MAQPSSGTSQAQAAFEAGTTFKPWEFELNALGDEDIEIRITHSGVCYSDIHTVKGDWGPQTGFWPIVPGHEIVGEVTQIGARVTRFKIGDRAGVGPQALSCGECKHCHAKRENYCQKIVFTYASTLPNGYVTKGGYAQYHRTNEQFAVQIPVALRSAIAAPLLCAGITVYAPLKAAALRPGSRVGVIGIGGLGHLALQFAVAMGAHVTALSHSNAKRAEAASFGAAHFIDTTDAAQVAAARGTFDLIINTTSAPVAWDALMACLDVFGRWVQLGVPPGGMNISMDAILFRGVTVTGSLIGSPSEIEEMLQVAEAKGVAPVVEEFAWTDVNAAVQRVESNNVRYRAVLVLEH